MKQYWKKIELKIDALSLRERLLVFVAAAVIMVWMLNAVLVEPLFAKQRVLGDQLKSDNEQIASIQTEIALKVAASTRDPDVDNKRRLQQLKQQATQMQNDMLAMQKDLISPDRMATVLEDILKREGALHLLSLKTLPVSKLGDPVSPDAKSAAAAKDKKEPAPGTGLVYRHGVEIVVQGSYMDMLRYMSALESMQWRLFWGKASLNVDDYPKATLRLTLFTLSLDKKWLNI